jgi:hypothetical protein
MLTAYVLESPSRATVGGGARGFFEKLKTEKELFQIFMPKIKIAL